MCIYFLCSFLVVWKIQVLLCKKYKQCVFHLFVNSATKVIFYFIKQCFSLQNFMFHVRFCAFCYLLATSFLSVRLLATSLFCLLVCLPPRFSQGQLFQRFGYISVLQFQPSQYHSYFSFV